MNHEQIWLKVRDRLRLYFGQTYKIQSISDLVNVSNNTIVAWLADEYPAKGENLVTLWHVLEAIGFDSPEMDDLPRFNRYLGELFAFSVIGINEVKELCNVSNSQTALQILRGQPPMHPALNYTELIAMYSDQLTEKKRDALLKLTPISDSISQSGNQTQARQTNEPVNVASAIQIGYTNDNGVLMAATVLGQALPIVRHLISDECTPADRNRVRELLGEGTMFELSNYFESLCSERARQIK